MRSGLLLCLGAMLLCVSRALAPTQPAAIAVRCLEEILDGGAPRQVLKRALRSAPELSDFERGAAAASDGTASGGVALCWGGGRGREAMREVMREGGRA